MSGLLGDELEDNPNRLREIAQRNRQPNRLRELLGALKDPGFYMGLLENTRQAGGGLLAGTLGAPVDIATMMMRPLGYKTPDRQVVGSSEHIGGLLGLDTGSIPYKVGSLLPTDPSDAAKYGLLGMGHVAYHGSPYKFDKFDMSKIGTGEGAQAYGHGLYFAESPEVAKGYRDTLANARPLDGFDHEKGYGVLDKGEMRWFSNEADARDFRRYEQSSLYKVDIPDEAIPKMLDWDKPLSQQPGVRAQLRAAAESAPDAATRRLLEKAAGPKADNFWQSGGEFYRQLTSFMSQNAPSHLGVDAAENMYQANASNLLRQTGIPGIRYKDGASRHKDGGTHNYVLFDDALVKILERK